MFYTYVTSKIDSLQNPYQSEMSNNRDIFEIMSMEIW